MYYEVPFYFFLIVIASVLFSWEEAYQMYYLQCKEDENGVRFGDGSIVSLDQSQVRQPGANGVNAASLSV